MPLQARHEVTGCEVSEGYGLTETSPTATSNPGNGRQIGTTHPRAAHRR